MAEGRRIRAADDRALSEHRKRQIQQAQEAIRNSPTAQVGGSLDMREARLRFAHDMETRAKPGYHRKQLREATAKKKEEDSRKREEEQQRRQEQAAAAARRRAQKDQELNERKRQHWTGPDRIASGSNPDVGNVLAGKWKYMREDGSLGDFFIENSPEGQFTFRGPGGRVGIMEACENGFQAKLASETGAACGVIRFLPVSLAHAGRFEVKTWYKKEGAEKWGKENIAWKPESPVMPGLSDRASSSIVATLNKDQSWQCNRCTLINAGDQNMCEACEAQRPGVPVRDEFYMWLEELGLTEYHEGLRHLGIVDLKGLVAARQTMRNFLIEQVGVTHEHDIRFEQALNDRKSPGSLECPVCLAEPEDGIKVALVPCGHVFCAEHAAQAVGEEACFVCRTHVTNTLRLFPGQGT